ncbi:MAG: polysaccharide biosynthesis/export family protein [Candidatus Binatia bacterium]
MTSCQVFALAALIELVTPGCSAAFSRPPGPDDPEHQTEIKRLMQSRSQAAGQLNYEIAPGDRLDVRIPGMEELTDTFTVSEEGSVVFPLAGSITLAGLTERQAAERLRTRISKFIVVPEVTLSVSEFHGRQVSVIGALGSPGVYPLRAANETLADIITQAGGITSDAGPRIYFTPAEVGRKGVAESSEAAARLGIGRFSEGITPDAKAVPIDLTRLYEGKNVPELGIPLRNGDAILVPKGGEVYVEGWVNTPGAFELSRALTLSQAISNAGGFHFAASTGSVRLLRLGADNQLGSYDVDYQSIAAGRDTDVYLDTGDRVQVGSNPLKVVPWGLYAFVKGIFSFSIGGGVTAGR